MPDQPRVTMTPDELAIELFATSQIIDGRGEAERLLKQIKDKHAHALAEQLRTEADKPRTPIESVMDRNLRRSRYRQAADHIDPGVQR